MRTTTTTLDVTAQCLGIARLDGLRRPQASAKTEGHDGDV